MANVQQLSTTEEKHKIDVETRNFLASHGASGNDERVEIVSRNLAVFYEPVVHVVDAEGALRVGAGDRPMTLRALVEELLLDPNDADARTLRWKEFGKSIV